MPQGVAKNEAEINILYFVSGKFSPYYNSYLLYNLHLFKATNFTWIKINS